MSENKLSPVKIVAFVLFSLFWFFLYWLITQLVQRVSHLADPWIPVVFLLIPYLIIVSKVWGVVIKAGTGGVEVSPISEKFSKVETGKTIADRLRSEVPSEREELINLLTKSEFERLSQEHWRRVKGIAKYIAVYTNSPISTVITISKANYKYFPVIDNDRRRELRGIVTYSELLDYKMRNEAWEHRHIADVLKGRKKPAARAYENESTKGVLQRMLKNNLTELPVVDANNRLKGVITLKDLSEVVI